MPKIANLFGRNLAAGFLFCLVTGVAATAASGAVITTYPDRPSLLAAVGPDYTIESFDGFPNETNITNQVAGVVFSSPYQSQPGYFPIRAEDSLAASSAPNILRGGFNQLNLNNPQVMVLDLDPPVNAFSFELSGQDPPASPVTVTFLFTDQSSSSVQINDTDGLGLTPEFFGVTTDVEIVRVTFTGGFKQGGAPNGSMEEAGVDDLILGHLPTDVNPPICSGIPELIQGDFPQITGTATDNQTGDTGIDSIVIAPGSVNLALSITPFTSGDPVANFVLTQADPLLPADGGIIATDVSGKTCTLSADWLSVPHGPVNNLPLCDGNGLLFEVTNGELTPAGTAACLQNLPGPNEPPYPPGYETSPPEDPFPCLVNTIQSPIFGQTEMIIKKDGPFEPKLRMLYSNLVGTNFTPFSDVTTSVEQIATIVPDPTKIKGSSGWSTVKVVCALQNELCNGLDDDGDGSIDEGIPTGGPVIDADLDGFPLCASGQLPADCNDQIFQINPGAGEVCNGLDDDCDGTADDGSPQGGNACPVAGFLGACSLGVTSCANGPMVCAQLTNSPGTPIVTILPPPPPLAGDPAEVVPFSAGVQIVDPDGDETHLVHEVVYLDGCPVFDGSTYGDMDGLVTDELMPLERGTLCTALTLCGQSVFENPVFRVEATDCGGNTGFAESSVIGSFTISPTLCIASQNPAAMPGDVGRSVRLARINGDRIRMTWGVTTNSETYHVWRADNPFMNNAMLLANTPSLIMDLGGDAKTLTPCFYLIRGVNAGGVEGP